MYKPFQIEMNIFVTSYSASALRVGLSLFNLKITVSTWIVASRSRLANCAVWNLIITYYRKIIHFIYLRFLGKKELASFSSISNFSQDLRERSVFNFLLSTFLGKLDSKSLKYCFLYFFWRKHRIFFNLLYYMNEITPILSSSTVIILRLS